MIPQEIINDILAKADIVQVISNYIPVQKKGTSFVAVCPFHNDKNPSLMISPSKQIYKCFACGAGGNAFTFVAEYEKIKFIEAVKRVATIINYSSPLLEVNTRQIDDKTKALLKATNDACDLYHYVLSSQAGKKGREYLNMRNIGDDMISYFKIGYSPQNGESTIKVLRSKGNEISVLDEAGINTHLGNTFSDRFQNRIIFPLFNEYSEPIGFSGRRIEDNDEAKYVNSPSTLLFNKSNVLYNYQNAKNEAKRTSYCYVVEGFMDVFSLYRVGIRSCVALMGTAFTKMHAKMLKKLNCEIRLMLDGDDAGQHGMINMLSILDNENIAYKIVDYGSSKLDPDEIYNQYDGETLLKLSNRLIDKSQFVIRYYSKRLDLSTVEGKKEFTIKVAQCFSSFKDSLEYEAIVKEVSAVIGISINAIKQVFNYVSVQGDNNADFDYRDIIRKRTQNRIVRAQRLLIRSMITSFKAREYIDSIPKVVFVDDIYNALANYIIELGKENKEFEVKDLITLIQSSTDNNRKMVNELISISEDSSISKDYTEEAINETINITLEDINKLLFENKFNDFNSNQDELTKAKMLDERMKGKS